MARLTVRGPVELKGTVRISGSKNGSLPVLIASLLTDEKMVIRNVPDIADVKVILDLLRLLGKKVIFSNNAVEITGELLGTEAPYDLVNRMRASILVLGPLAVRKKTTRVSLPGGCAIGSRPINIHLDGFRKLGCTERLESGYVVMNARNLKPARILMDFPSVGATENLLLAASLIPGKSILENTALEPEIEILSGCLVKMGAGIEHKGSILAVTGRKRLHGTVYTVPPDRIEAGTYLMASAATEGKILIEDFPFSHSGALLDKIGQAGIRTEKKKNSLLVHPARRVMNTDIETAPYPGFPTDLQPLWAVLMTRASGKTVIQEHIFKHRFSYLDEIRRMGGEFILRDNVCEVIPSALKGADVKIPDLRAGAALLIASLIAKGKTLLEGKEHLDRGYEKLDLKLKKLGADIKTC